MFFSGYTIPYIVYSVQVMYLNMYPILLVKTISCIKNYLHYSVGEKTNVKKNITEHADLILFI